jgi:hypothetical protein
MKPTKSSSNPLIALSVVLSMSAVIAVAAHWPQTGNAASGATAVVHRAAPVHVVRVVMHDPGCHWFQTDAGLKRTLTVKGPVNLTNMDEAALRVAGPKGTKTDHVGANVHLARGTYHITMVGQASDDNHLKLTVS